MLLTSAVSSDPAVNLQLGLAIELSVLPPYLYSLWSIKPRSEGASDAAVEAVLAMRSVLYEEMLHAGLVVNILNAIGATPVVTGELMRYPGVLPGHVTSGPYAFEVELRPLSSDAVRTFMRIELPEWGARLERGWTTIPEFYATVKKQLGRLAPDAFRHGRQLPPRDNPGGGRLVAVEDYDSAVQATDTIVNQGEGFFKGSLYWNPSTMNNNDYQPTYDAQQARLDWAWMERHGVRSVDDFDRYAIQPQVLQTPNSRGVAAVSTNCPPAEWNFYGGNTCGFLADGVPRIEWPDMFSKPNDPVLVTGHTNAAGAYISGDPWSGAPMRMNGGMVEAKLVDVDPICPWSTQIYADSISLGSKDLGSGFVARTAGRAHARWLNFFRNRSGKMMIAGIASTVFQIGLPRSGVEFFSTQPPAGSLDEQLRRVLGEPGVQGLMVRFVAYSTIYFQGDAFNEVRPTPPPQPPQFDYFPVMARLYADYADRFAAYKRGELADPPPVPVNRAYSKTVGWIAPWMDGELRSMPGGRILFSAIAPQKRSLGPVAMECAVDPLAPDKVARLTVDLGSAIPETDASGTKMDFGTLQIGVLAPDGSGAPRIVAQIPYGGGYDRQAYEKTSGIVDIPSSNFIAPLATADAFSRLFCISHQPDQETAPGMLSLECAFVAQTDARGVYVNEPNARWTAKPGNEAYKIAIQIRHLGGPPPQGTRLGIVQYSADSPGFNQNGLRIVSSDVVSNGQRPYLELIGRWNESGDGYVVVPVPAPKGKNPFSMVNIGVRAVRPGCPTLGFYPIAPGTAWRAPAGVSAPEIGPLFYAAVRVLPFHNQMADSFEDWLKTGPSIDLVSQRVFDEVFKTYFLMYPVMRFIRDPLQLHAWRGRVLEMTDPLLQESAIYMPATRSMSAGQRRILELWYSYAMGEMPTTPQPPSTYTRRA